MAEAETETKLLTYVLELEKLKPFHNDIDMILKKLVGMLNLSKLAQSQTMKNITHHNNRMDSQLSENELSYIYSNIPILNDTLPNYRREVKNLLTLKQNEIDILFRGLVDVIVAANEKREHTIIKHVGERTKTEQEIKDYEQIQKEDFLKMVDCPSQVRFGLLKDNIQGRISTEEEKQLTNNICSKLFGKNIEELEWERKKGKDAKNVKLL